MTSFICVYVVKWFLTLFNALLTPRNHCRWAFDATNPTAHAAWRAFHDHVQTPAGTVKNSHVWNPKVIAGNCDEESLMYKENSKGSRTMPCGTGVQSEFRSIYNNSLLSVTQKRIYPFNAFPTMP